MPNWKKVIVSGSDAVLNDITSSGTFISSDLTGSFYLGTHNVGIDFNAVFPITGSGIIVSQSNLPANHYNMVKIGEVELVDYNDGFANPSFLIDTIDKTFIISASNTNNAVAQFGSGDHKLYNSDGSTAASFGTTISIGTNNTTTTFGAQDSLTIQAGVDFRAKLGNSLHNGIYEDDSSDENDGNYLWVAKGKTTAVTPPLTQGLRAWEAYPILGGAVTASAVSSSGDLFAGLTENSTTGYNTVVYNSTTGQFFYTGSYGGGGTTGGVTSLNTLEDIITLVAGPNITITESGQTIEISGSAGGTAFTTMSVAGQDDILTDTDNDTLTFAAGPGITITTDASTDTIAISASNSDNDWHVTADDLWVTSSRDVAVTGSIHLQEPTNDESTILSSGDYEIALRHTNSTSHQIFIGYNAGGGASAFPSSQNNISIGYNAGYQLGTASNTISIGYQAGYNAGNSINNSIVVGFRAGYQAQSTNSIIIGNNAGYQAESDESIFIGKDAGNSYTATDSKLIIGFGNSPIFPLIEGNLKTDKKVEVSGSLYAHVGQSNANYGNQSSKPVSGFEIRNGDAYTYVTPQSTTQRYKLHGALLETNSNSDLKGYPSNHIVYSKIGGVIVGNSGGGGTTPSDDQPTVKVVGSSFEIQPEGAVDGGPTQGLRITPKGSFEFFRGDANTSEIGTLLSVSASAKIEFNTSSNAMEFFAGSTNEELQKVMFVSKSGRNARIGVGTDNPQSTFDFKDVQDSSQGTQLFLRSARSDEKGADPNDNAGALNFTIDSGSYNDLATSGSLAQISTEVKTVTNEGVIGDLILKAATSEKEAPIELMRVSGNGSTLTGSLEITSYTKANKIAIGNINPSTVSNGSAIIENDLYVNDSTRFGLSSADNHTFNGDITASNHISASGIIYANGAVFTGDLVATGSFTASGLNYPNTDGLDRQVIKTDGNGNLSFGYPEATTIAVKNVSGGSIPKGTPCYITASGTSGNIAGIIPADASNPNLMPAGIIAGETLADEAEGIGLVNGFIQGVDTSTFTSGDTVYVAVGGGYTNVKPTGSGVLIQKLGNVEKVDNTNGSGVINGPGYYNELPNWETYEFGYEITTAFPVTGSGLIVSSSYLPANHYNMVKIGETELLDLNNSALTSNTFFIHNVDNFVVASGSEPVNIYGDGPAKLFEHTGDEFKVYAKDELKVTIDSGSTTTSNLLIASGRISTKATEDTGLQYVAGFTASPTASPRELIFVTASTFGGGGSSSTPYSLGTFGGRYNWSSTESDTRIAHGFVNGPTAGATANDDDFGPYLDTHTIDTTTETFNTYKAQYYGLYSPVAGVPHIKAWGRSTDTDFATNGCKIGISLWTFTEPANGAGSTTTATLRASSPMITVPNSTILYVGNGMEASGSQSFPAGTMYLVTMDLSGSLAATANIYMNFHLWIE